MIYGVYFYPWYSCNGTHVFPQFSWANVLVPAAAEASTNGSPSAASAAAASVASEADLHLSQA